MSLWVDGCSCVTVTFCEACCCSSTFHTAAAAAGAIAMVPFGVWGLMYVYSGLVLTHVGGPQEYEELVISTTCTYNYILAGRPIRGAFKEHQHMQAKL